MSNPEIIDVEEELIGFDASSFPPQSARCSFDANGDLLDIEELEPRILPSGGDIVPAPVPVPIGRR